MFEKEAEEYVNKDTWLFETARQDAKYHFQQGAEFGYNKANEEIKLLKETHRQSIDILVEQIEELHKANEWHYVKGGDLPPEDTRVFALMVGGEVCIAHFYRKNVWDKIGTVYAWKEIVLPKEIKEK